MFESQNSGTGFSGEVPPRSVLVVEDDGLIALTLEDTVRDFGVHNVHVANTAELARLAADEGQFDCAILDVLIGHDETYDIADRLALRNVPFLFCSAFTRDQLIERHRHRPWIGKPYRDEDLLAWLTSLMGAVVPSPA